MSREHGGDTCILVSRLTKIFRPLEVHPLSWPPIRRQSPVCVLRDVDLSVGRGEILGLLGTNGAGKTTLLKILATLILPTAGRITIEGVDVIHEPHRAIQLVSLVTADERSFYWPLTGRQNLEFFAAFQGLGRDAARRRIEELQEQLGLKPSIDNSGSIPPGCGIVLPSRGDSYDDHRSCCWMNPRAAWIPWPQTASVV